MTKYEKRKKIEYEKIPVLRICDFCGKKERPSGLGIDDTAITEFHIVFGYGSKFDTEIWNFDICDDCAERLKKIAKYKKWRRKLNKRN